jgi:hypothetical protein
VISRCAPRSFDRHRMGLARTAVSKVRLWAALSIILATTLLLGVGCSHPVMQGDAPRANPNPVPFRDSNHPATAVPDPAVANTITNKAEPALPFQDVESLPVGTLLSVRLNSAVSAGPGSAFAAVLDEPVKIGDNVVVPKGAAVSGHVESAQVSDVEKNRGSIRLNLQSIEIGGRELPLQTSSLFTRGTAHLILTDGGNTPANVMTLEKGRRLTFRLTEPVYLAAQRSTPAQ